MSNKRTSVASEFAALADDDYISIRDAARLKGIGLNTVKRMMTRGELPFVRLSPRRIGIKLGVARQPYQPTQECL